MDSDTFELYATTGVTTEVDHQVLSALKKGLVSNLSEKGQLSVTNCPLKGFFHLLNGIF